MQIQAILVPRGAEYQAIANGIQRGLGDAAASALTKVVTVPMGVEPIRQFLTAARDNHAAWLQPDCRIILMGLCGSLAPDLAVGDGVIYQTCHGAGDRHQPCDPQLTSDVQQILGAQVRTVDSWTSDRLIHLAAEKQQLHQSTTAAVVDMEGLPALEVLQGCGVGVAIVRVVSDNAQHDLPQLAGAFGAEGNLRPLPLAMGMIRQPVGAVRLITGSLRGLNRLTAIAEQLAPYLAQS